MTDAITALTIIPAIVGRVKISWATIGSKIKILDFEAFFRGQNPQNFVWHD